MKPQESSTVPGPGALCFVATALFFLAIGTVALAVQPGFLLADTLTGAGRIWALVMLYGFGFPAVFGTVYWALPAAYSLSLFSRPAVFLHLGFHLAGLVTVLLASFFPTLPQASMGVTFLACGGVIFVVNISMSLRGLAFPDASSGFLVAMLVWLVAALFLGLPFAASAPLPLLDGTNWPAGWLVLVFAGVLINTILGLALRVTALGVGAEVRPSLASWYALAVTNGAIAWMVPALTYGPLPGGLFCAGIFLLGILVYLGDFHGILQRRPAPDLGWDARIQLTALWMISGTAALVLLAVWERIQVQALSAGDALAAAAVPAEAVEVPVWSILPMDWTAGLSALLATATPGLVALVFQLLKLSGTRTAEKAVPTVRERLAEHLLLASFFNYAVGAGMVILGAWGASEKIVSLGAIFLVVGSLGFIGNFFQALSKSPSGLPTAAICPTS